MSYRLDQIAHTAKGAGALLVLAAFIAFDAWRHRHRITNPND